MGSYVMDWFRDVWIWLQEIFMEDVHAVDACPVYSIMDCAWRVTYRPGRLGLANPRFGPSSFGGLTSSFRLSPVISSGEDASTWNLLEDRTRIAGIEGIPFSRY